MQSSTSQPAAQHQGDAPAIANANKALVRDYLARVWNAHDADALPGFVAPDLQQHNPGMADGLPALDAFMRGFFAAVPDGHFALARIIAEDDVVVTHTLFRAHATDHGTAVVDIYRIESGLIAEHWDVKEPVAPASASGRPIV